MAMPHLTCAHHSQRQEDFGGLRSAQLHGTLLAAARAQPQTVLTVPHNIMYLFFLTRFSLFGAVERHCAADVTAATDTKDH